MRSRIAVLPLALALVFAGCDDQLVGPESPIALFDHETGDPANAVFDLDDPVLEGEADGADALLTWTSGDNYLDADFNAGDWEFDLDRWKFEIYRQLEGESEFTKIFDDWHHEWGASPECTWDDVELELECTYVDVDPSDGTHQYYVKAVAREGTPQGGSENFTMHHSHASNVEDVTIGGSVFHVQFTYSPGQSIITDHSDGYTEAIDDLNYNAANWDLEFMILENLSPITDCAPNGSFDAVTIEGGQEGTTSNYTPNSCEDGVYQFEFDNSEQSDDSFGIITVKLDGDPVANDEVDFTSTGPGGGPFGS